MKIETVREACLVAGFLLMGYGLWLVFPPAAFIICGALLIWVGLPPRQRQRGVSQGVPPNENARR